MEIPWLNEWINDPEHQLQLLMGVVFVVMWILGKFLGITNEDFQGYWERRDDSSFDDD